VVRRNAGIGVGPRPVITTGIAPVTSGYAISPMRGRRRRRIIRPRYCVY
jgi:hypothetical protein